MSNPIRCQPTPQSNRKFVERNRRKEMKALFSTLNSLLPNQTSMEAPRTVPDQLEDATNYIKELQKNIKKLKEKKEKLMGMEEDEEAEGRRRRRGYEDETKPKLSVHVKAHQIGSSVEVFLTTGSDYHFNLQQVLRLLQDNGAEILNVNQSMFTDRVFHKITAQKNQSDEKTLEGCGWNMINMGILNWELNDGGLTHLIKPHV
ncbi:transcription factor bHLH162 isoform X2 [Cucumis sativus]|uniref:transcription factor bHLH162 isoform X2 n=1 Tax=Cucumis sativus TaxID=3659 RepID=UPI0012F52AF9|nr:transcription factor bHLH162 isoform X2 [Cucumis sativus]